MALLIQNKLKVLDINVWSGLDYSGYLSMGAYEPDSIRMKRYQALLHQIESLSPDVIGAYNITEHDMKNEGRFEDSIGRGRTHETP